MNIEVELPNKLSALLRMAVEDAHVIEQTPGYQLNMHRWHAPDPSGICQVCMAGAVIARKAIVPKSEHFHPEYDTTLGRKLAAINQMRAGNMFTAFQYLSGGGSLPSLSIQQEDALQSAGIRIDYMPGIGRAPWASYLDAASIFEKAGL